MSATKKTDNQASNNVHIINRLMSNRKGSISVTGQSRTSGASTGI